MRSSGQVTEPLAGGRPWLGQGLREEKNSEEAALGGTKLVGRGMDFGAGLVGVLQGPSCNS